MKAGRWYLAAIFAAVARASIVLSQGAEATNQIFSAAVVGATNAIAGASVTVYAGGSNAATSLGSGVSDSSGNVSFEIANPGGDAVLYAVARGGDDGKGANSAIALMTVMGTGSNYASSVVIDELTTVASVWAMANFFHPNATIFGPAPGLQNAALTVANLANIATGQPSPLLADSWYSSPAKLNTLSNLLAACVGSSGVSSANCRGLFGDSTVTGGAAPTDTIGAAFNIATNPVLNLDPLFAISQKSSAYASAFPGPPLDWLLSVNIPTVGIPIPIAIDASGNLWVGNNLAGGGVAKLNPNGVPAEGSPFTGGGLGGLNAPEAIAIDPSGNVWIANHYPATTLSELDQNGSPISPDTGYQVDLFQAQGIAADRLGNIWVTNDQDYPGPGSLLEFDSNAQLIFRAAGSAFHGFYEPGAIAIDSSGNTWFTSGVYLAPGEKPPNRGGSVMEFNSSGRLSPEKGYQRGISAPLVLATDPQGNIWIANGGDRIGRKHHYSFPSWVSKYSTSGRLVSPAKGYVGGGINMPNELAIDGAGNVWIINLGDVGAFTYPISELRPNGTPISPQTGYVIDDSYLDTLKYMAIDPSGNIWITNAGVGMLLEIVGAAAPVKTPVIGPATSTH